MSLVSAGGGMHWEDQNNSTLLRKQQLLVMFHSASLKKIHSLSKVIKRANKNMSVHTPYSNQSHAAPGLGN